MDLNSRDIVPLRDVSLSVTGVNWTTTKAFGTYFKTFNGYWFFANIYGVLSSAASSFSGTVAGIDNAVDAAAVSAYLREAGVADRTPTRASMTSSGGAFIVESASNFDTIRVSIILKISGEPTI